jgi:hypothetical protein
MCRRSQLPPVRDIRLQKEQGNNNHEAGAGAGAGGLWVTDPSIGRCAPGLAGRTEWRACGRPGALANTGTGGDTRSVFGVAPRSALGESFSLGSGACWSQLCFLQKCLTSSTSTDAGGNGIFFHFY